MKQTVSIFWFRRDLRLQDNAALYHALKSGNPVVPIFVFDTKILDKLEDKADKRVAFIHAAITDIQTELAALGSTLQVFYTTPIDAFKKLLETHHIAAAYTNHDYEQYAIDRDASIGNILQQNGASLHSYKDQVILEKNEVLKDDGKPYTVFTPYSR
jgi:deoxyribodipyrimidine photo-lyase